MKRQFTTNDVIALTGISARQLQWWDERKLIKPDRRGHRRLYSWDQLVTATVIGQLRRRGFSLQRLRKVVAFLEREIGTSLAATVRASSEYHLLSDGANLYLRTSARQVVDLLKNSSQPMFDICLSDEVRRVRAELARGALARGKTTRGARETKFREEIPFRKKRAASETVPLTRQARKA